MSVGDGLLRVGEVAALTGLSAKAVRMYEQRGLLGQTVRSSSGQRMYGGMAVAQLVRIRHLRALGLSLARIREVLDPAAPMSMDSALTMLRDELGDQIRRLEQVRAAVDAARASAVRDPADPAWQSLLVALTETDPQGGPSPRDDAAAADPPLPDGLEARLEELTQQPGWRQMSARLAGLRDAEWDDGRIGEVAVELALSVPPDLLPGELTAPAGFALLVGRRASAAQVRCLLQAGRRAHGPEQHRDAAQDAGGLLWGC